MASETEQWEEKEKGVWTLTDAAQQRQRQLLNVATLNELQKMKKDQLYAKYEAMYARRQAQRRGSARRLGNLPNMSSYKKHELIQCVLDEQNHSYMV